MYEWLSVGFIEIIDDAQHPRLANELLQQLPRQDFKSQFQTRRIEEVVILPIVRTKLGIAYGELHHKAQSFQILLAQGTSVDEQLLTIGHELGHTYFFCPVRIKESWSYRRSFHLCGVENAPPEEESFCEEFARQWILTCDNQGELRELLVKAHQDQLSTVVEVALEDIPPNNIPERHIHLSSLASLSQQEIDELPF